MDSLDPANFENKEALSEALRRQFSSLSADEKAEIYVSQFFLIVELKAQDAVQQDLVEKLSARVDELEKKLGKGDPPPWVKPNASPHSQKPKIKPQRKRRPHAFSRKRLDPTDTVYHVLERCPDCDHILKDGWKHRARQVIDLPQQAVKVTDHIVIGRHCGVCGKNWAPQVDLSGEVVGHHALGLGLMSLIGYLRTVCRLPIRGIRSLLQSLYGLEVGIGTIVAATYTIAQQGKETLQSLLNHVRGSPIKHGDETGWREGGQNGYLWSFSTPTVRYMVYNRSRAGSVADEVLGASTEGVLVCDFYGGYNGTACLRQRCWVHFLRDLHKLKEMYPEDGNVCDWANSIIDLYREAERFQQDCKRAPNADVHGPLARQDKRRQFESRLSWLAAPYLELPKEGRLPQTVLAERCERFAPELFIFVERPEVPSGNNAAERAIRPSVIARKISGGTRSAKGSETQANLMSLFGTWQLQELNSFEQCKNMLAARKTAEATA